MYASFRHQLDHHAPAHPFTRENLKALGHCGLKRSRLVPRELGVCQYYEAINRQGLAGIDGGTHLGGVYKMSNWKYSTYSDYAYAYADQTAYIRHEDGQEWTAIYGPTSNATIQPSFGGMERAREGPFVWRRTGGSPWTLQAANFDEEVSQGTALPPEDPSLYLVLHGQSEGEPDHWSIFVACEGQRGDEYQVTGDAESMPYLYQPDIDILSTDSYKNSYILVRNLSTTAQAWVKHYTESETPPSAPNRAAVTENCQGWAY